MTEAPSLDTWTDANEILPYPRADAVRKRVASANFGLRRNSIELGAVEPLNSKLISFSFLAIAWPAYPSVYPIAYPKFAHQIGG